MQHRTWARRDPRASGLELTTRREPTPGFRSGLPPTFVMPVFGRDVRARICPSVVCKAVCIASGSGTVRHEVGTDYERALSEFGTHRHLPANRRSAAEAIRRHAQHQRTSVANAYWLEYADDRIRAVIVNFRDGTRCWVSWGWVCHYGVSVPGAEEENGEWTTWLPENRRQHGRRGREREVAMGECPCTPGLKQPLGSECAYDGELIED
jgi:hypothetical protein